MQSSNGTKSRQAGTLSWPSILPVFASHTRWALWEAQIKDTWLWPGQSLSTGEEITVARLHKGDVARFVVFTGPAGDYSHSVVTKSFPIDEELARTDVPFRVRH